MKAQPARGPGRSATEARSEKPATDGAAKGKPANALIESVSPTTPPSDAEKANVAVYKQVMQSPAPKQPLTGPLPNIPVTPSKKAGPAAAAEKECKMGAELVGEIPIVGKPLMIGPLTNVPVTPPKGTALPKMDGT